MPVLARLVEALEIDLLVLDVRPGRGSFALTPRAARALARKVRCDVAAMGVGTPLPVPALPENVADVGAFRIS